MRSSMASQLEAVSLSADLLYAVQTEGTVETMRDRLARLDRSRLDATLGTRYRRLAFWINCYNAYAQLLVEEDPELLEAGFRSRWRFFSADRLPIAGVWLSLDDIEHGILRCSKHPWGLGYLPRPFPSTFEKRFRLKRLDPRIHFVLNWGAESCPPVSIYSPDTLDEDLDVATSWYVSENVHYDSEESVATVPRLFSWYRGDFGGRRGVIDFLRSHDAIPDDATPSLTYDEHDWSVDVDADYSTN